MTATATATAIPPDVDASPAKEDVVVAAAEDATATATTTAGTSSTGETVAAVGSSDSLAVVMDQIAERLLFFFSDANIRSDRFMQKQLVREDHDDDFGGTIAVDVLMKFKSIQQYIPHDDGGEDLIVQTVKEHESLKDFLFVSEAKNENDKYCIGRVHPMKKAQWNDNIPLSLHVSNIPIKNGRYMVGIQDIKSLFEPYGKVMLIKLKWHTPYNNNDGKDNHYKNNNARMTPTGTCLVEYSTKEECHTALKALAATTVTTESTNESKDDSETKEEKSSDRSHDDAETLMKPTTVLELKGSVLTVESLEKWIEQRKKEKASRKEKKKHDDENGKTDTTATPNHDKKRKADTDAEDDKATTTTPLPEFTMDWKKNCVIELKGLNAETCDREAIRAVLDGAGFEKTVYADYSRGQDYGAIRFTNMEEDANEESEILKKRMDFCEALNAGTILIGGAKVESAKLLQGEEEELYWKNFMDFKTKQLRAKAQERPNKNNNRNNSNKRRRR